MYKHFSNYALFKFTACMLNMTEKKKSKHTKMTSKIVI